MFWRLAAIAKIAKKWRSIKGMLWMKGKTEPPRQRDRLKLPNDGPMVGMFWHRRRCERPPYDKLLSNSVLRADYHTQYRGTRDI